MANFVTVENDHILWASVGLDGRTDHELLTDRPGHYVRVWTRNYQDTRQVCNGGGHRGWTLAWAGKTTEERARNLAKGLRGRFLKNKAAFEREIASALQSQ